MKYLLFLMSYILYNLAKPEPVGEAPPPPAAEEPAADEEKEKEEPEPEFGQTVICDNPCMKNDGYTLDKEKCKPQQGNEGKTVIECIEKPSDSKKLEEKEEGEGEEEAPAPAPEHALKPKGKAAKK